MKAGSLVECIKIDQGMINLAETGFEIPELNETYTVRTIEYIPEYETSVIRVEEIVNPPAQWRQGFLECAFNQPCFRELHPPIDLSFIDKILQDEPVLL